MPTNKEHRESQDHLVGKLSMEETARQMAAAAEDWSEWDRTVGDGLDEYPFDQPADAGSD